MNQAGSTIHLVQHDKRLVIHHRQRLRIQFRQGGSVEDRKFQVGIGGPIERPPDPFGLDFIGGFTQARRIRKHDREASKVEVDFHHIPGRARPLRNDGGFTARQHIQQAGLAGIGSTKDRYVDAVPQPFTPTVVVEMGCDLTGQSSNSGRTMPATPSGRSSSGKSMSASRWASARVSR